ncbi:RAD55 family ATPase [Methanohalophilus halophilus]|uniref:RecA-superfamily ATPase, KaiC/GvpD/RAD55 family n=1 Tax=Methanohalophilus halophilus TaxID=2177 RepID=A0A1L3Q4D9_9EURY|nr:RAD55 family ATPase [Methanohalophilus halophilus]APH39752.1 hypothetical protein BHR79_09855 [Methanohalophilus halophilus]RNI08910.1 hypothetical protein EFE40_05405 [Methanohalophilus halophilus]SDW38846.1 RecA-superfamily ATPase, KaiC/GvpD/RAD55 family [Methanohalophilus halophilus]
MVLAGIGIKELPSSSIILIEEEIGSIKGVFVQRTAYNMAKEGKKVLYISSTRSEDEVVNEMNLFKMEIPESMKLIGNSKAQLTLMEILNAEKAKKFLKNQNLDESVEDMYSFDVFVIDTYSYLFMDESFDRWLSSFEQILEIRKNENAIFIITTDVGVLEERVETTIRSLVDGIIQFKVDKTGNKVNRYMLIPKMKGLLPMDKIVPFKVTGEGILLDVRERVG